jgi:hypothetical protein
MLLAFDKPPRHFPAVFEVQLSRDVFELEAIVRDVDGAHLFAVDPRPDAMGVSSPFLFVKDDDPRLAGQLKSLLDFGDRSFEGIDRDVFVFRRVAAGSAPILAAWARSRRFVEISDCPS